jgi:hypothetical protein
VNSINCEDNSDLGNNKKTKILQNRSKLEKIHIVTLRSESVVQLITPSHVRHFPLQDTLFWDATCAGVLRARRRPVEAASPVVHASRCQPDAFPTHSCPFRERFIVPLSVARCVRFLLISDRSNFLRFVVSSAF